MTEYASIVQAYQGSKRRLLLLDYDGTLVDFKPRPDLAKPPTNLKRLLDRLGSDPQNTAVIISGRDQTTLDNWFGRLPLTLIAEHGYAIKRPGANWHTPRGIDDRWKVTVRLPAVASTKRIAGSFIEEKSAALVWHYRVAKDQTLAAKEAKTLRRELRKTAAIYDLSILLGNKIVEIKPRSINKGVAAEELVAEKTYDFILAAGDDITDEDLFAAMPQSAFTVKVGSNPTIARLILENSSQLRTLLAQSSA